MTLSKSEVEAIAKRFARDLSILRPTEIAVRWSGADRALLNSFDPVGFDARLEDHNPIYYLARQVYFNKVIALPRYLHAPLHRTAFCDPILDYILNPKPSEAGFLYLGPRNTFKSTFSHGVIPLWFAIRGKVLHDEDARIVLRHHKEKMASRNLVRLKNKLRFHKWLRWAWPEFCPTGNPRDFGTKTEFTFPNASLGEVAEASVMAIGAASDTGSHYDLDCGDDLVQEDHISSKVIRDEALARYDAKRYTMDETVGREINTGTPYHINDLWAKMRESKHTEGPRSGEKFYHTIEVPAGGFIGDHDYGPLAHPIRLSADILSQRRAQEIQISGNDNLWQLQYQIRSRTTWNIATDRSWLRFCSAQEISPNAWWAILVDPAWKGDKNAGEGDFTAIEVWAFERRGNLVLKYLVDGIFSNELTSTDGESIIFRLMRMYGIMDVACEEHGGHAFRTRLQNEAATRGVPINVDIDFAMKRTNKQQRMAVFCGTVQKGLVFICEECNPVLKRAFIEQFCEFPQCVTEICDALDCAAYTCDPNIEENLTPAFNTGERQRPWWAQKPQTEDGYADAPMTRHCGV